MSSGARGGAPGIQPLRRLRSGGPGAEPPGREGKGRRGRKTPRGGTACLQRTGPGPPEHPAPPYRTPEPRPRGQVHRDWRPARFTYNLSGQPPAPEGPDAANRPGHPRRRRLRRGDPLLHRGPRLPARRGHPRPDGSRWVVVEPPGPEPGTALLLARAGDGSQQARVGDQTGGRVGFFLHTDDFARDHARMTAAGVTFLEEPRREPYGTVAVFRDLYGNRWDLLQPAAP
ncbi:hypothetical protein DN402_31920 [Streptomyces sp. SW4]|nr:hypothetical protein DN402_31920 [Streptomyces sp. SW4]